MASLLVSNRKVRFRLSVATVVLLNREVGFPLPLPIAVLLPLGLLFMIGILDIVGSTTAVLATNRLYRL